MMMIVGVLVRQFPTTETLNVLNIIEEIIHALCPLVCSLSGIVDE